MGLRVAYSASFDCSKAKSIPEYLICNTPELSQADDELKVIFEAARDKAEDQQAFREQTRARWNEREKTCRDVPCLQQWYAQQKAFYGAQLGSTQLLQASNAVPSGGMIDNKTEAAASRPQSKQAFDCKGDNCPYFSDFYKASSDFQAALKSAVRSVHEQFPEWVPDGTMSPMKPISIGNEVATIGSICEPHNCPHQIITIFYRDSNRLVGMFMQDEANGSWLGNPADYEKAVLRAYDNAPGSFKIGQAFPGPSQNASQASTNRLASTSETGMPGDENTLISIVATAQQGSRDAANDMQRGGVKAQRDKQLCQSIKSLQARNWIGRVTKIDANSDGKGILSIEVADRIIITTWNNSLSDLEHETLIEPGSPVFNAASVLKKGQQVRFSGSFFKGENGDCLFESSLTLSGKLREPEFIFRFSEISPI